MGARADRPVTAPAAAMDRFATWRSEAQLRGRAVVMEPCSDGQGHQDSTEHQDGDRTRRSFYIHGRGVRQVARSRFCQRAVLVMSTKATSSALSAHLPVSSAHQDAGRDQRRPEEPESSRRRWGRGDGVTSRRAGVLPTATGRIDHSAASGSPRPRTSALPGWWWHTQVQSGSRSAASHHS